MKKLVALALGTVMAVSMTAGVSAATVESKDDLKNATIGVQLGTTGDIEASEYEADGATVKRYSKGSEAIQALMAGQIDCVIIDSQPAQKFVENADGLKILDEPFVEEEYAICLKKGNDELLDKINGALKELKEDGTVDDIMNNYIGDNIGETPYESPEDVDRSNGTLVMATNAEFEPYLHSFPTRRSSDLLLVSTLILHRQSVISLDMSLRSTIWSLMQSLPQYSLEKLISVLPE